MSEKTRKIILAILFVVVGIIDLKLLSIMEKDLIDFSGAIIMELFITIHMSVFVFWPLSSAVNDNKENVKKTFIILFAVRALFLIFCDAFISTTVALLDFFFVFIGAFAIMPIFLGFFGKKKVPNNISHPSIPALEEKKCPKCGNIIDITTNFCQSCGEKISIGSPSSESPTPKEETHEEVKEYVRTTDFDPMFLLSDNEMIETVINKYLEKAKISKDTRLLPKDLLQKKTRFYAILCVLVFIYITMIFFHFPVLTYIIGAIIILVLALITRKYNITKYIKKEIKARPSEKISNIIMTTKENLVEDKTKKLIVVGIVVAVVAPLLIFKDPKILYEKMDNGYGVRFYAFGLINFKTAEIPSSYKGQPVISLRGNTFSNMPFLTKVTLPDTITEIRGQAFKNDILLKEVNIPINLEYLGGGAFYNCRSIISITLPDTLTTMGGEVFKNASSLETIKLSENLTEIRGNSFEECTSLKEVTIPDKVTRIGGHAFYGNTSLSTVTFTENSQLKEIGSSAFRNCSSLYTITIPKNAYVNFRAFKESPTSIRYFGYGQRSKFIYVTPDDLPSEVVSADYGTVYIKVDEVNYINYNNWEVKVSLTGGLTENLTFDYYHNEIFVKENFNLSISSCHSDEKVGIDISYN